MSYLFIVENNIAKPNTETLLIEPFKTIGAVGLGVKYIGESIVGVQYPDMSKRMKPDSTSDVEMSSVPVDNKQDLIGNVPVMNNSTSKKCSLYDFCQSHIQENSFDPM